MIAGVLLAGGRSRRFGSEKAMAPLGDGVLMDRPLQALAAVCPEVAVSARPESGAAGIAAASEYDLLVDGAEATPGPLAGIVPGLRWARERGATQLLTAPCDAPLLTPKVLERLVAASATSQGAAMAVSPAGPEPLVAIWPVSAGLEATAGLEMAAVHPPIGALLNLLGAARVRCAPLGDVDAPADLAGLERPAERHAADGSHGRLFAFEDDFVRSLRCIPMCVRFKLDRTAIKLSLRQWSRFTLADRQRLRRTACETPAEVEAYRALLGELVALRTGEAAKPLLEPPPAEWAQGSTPERVDAMAMERGGKALDAASWRRLAPLERYALVKLTRDKHENANFIPALKEFSAFEALADREAGARDAVSGLRTAAG